jgi:release factor glutamine methyltransferase
MLSMEVMGMPTSQVYTRLVAQLLDLLHRRIHQKRVVKLDGLQIQICPYVFNPITARTTKFFIQHMRIQSNTRVLEIGTGTGAIAAAAAKITSTVVATDINPYAIECAQETIRINDLTSRVTVVLGDLFTPVQSETFDVILFNPPYFRRQARSWLEKAWFAGPNCEFIHRFLSEARQVLTENGNIQILFSSAAPLRDILHSIREARYAIRVIAKGRLLGFIETIYLFQLF